MIGAKIRSVLLVSYPVRTGFLSMIKGMSRGKATVLDVLVSLINWVDHCCKKYVLSTLSACACVRNVGSHYWTLFTLFASLT